MQRSPFVVVALVVALMVAAPLVTPDARAAVPLRVLTYNIHHGEGPDGRVDVDRLAAELRLAAADVVGLQEVDRHYGSRSGGLDQAAELAARLGARVVFAAHLDLGGLPPRQYGTAVLTRLPVLATTTTPLPEAPGAEPRGLLEVVLAAPGGPLRVFSTHLSNRSADARERQARTIAGRVAASPEPVLLLGDLNARPDAPEVATLTALLVDAGRACGPTFPAPAPAERIDYVLGEGRVVDCAVLPTAASDHRPVLATVVVS